MPLKAILLFGSQARNDPSADSDTDLLLVTEDQETQHVSRGQVSMFFYGQSSLMADARGGDLFACHIVREATKIYDPLDVLGELRKVFVFRNSYSPVISQAADLGWYLARHGETLNSRLLVKRALWCVRTILVARSAELRTPVFAPDRLAKLSRSTVADKILLDRHRLRGDAGTRRLLAQFLSVETEPNSFFQSASSGEFIQRFHDTGNRVALQTLEQQASGDAEYR